MNRLLLLICAILTIFFSFDSKAQNIDSISITTPIVCNGDLATATAYITQTTPPTILSYILQFQNQFGFWVQLGFSAQGTGTTSPFPGLTPGTYKILIVDSAGYASPGGQFPSAGNIYDSQQFNVIGVPQLAASTQVVSSNLCFGDCTAEERIVITGGTPPYSVTMNGQTGVLGMFDNDTVLSNLCANTYSAVISDVNGCSTTPITTTFTISPISLLQPSGLISSDYNGQNISCYGASDGEITATVTGGTPPYSYSIDGVTFTSNNVFSGLTAGTYTITYQDANGCDTTETFTLQDPPDLSGSITVNQQVSCNSSCDGQIQFVVDNILTGTPPYSYSIDGGNTFQNTPVFSNLCGGTSHTILAQDANGCQYSSSVFLSEPPAITFNLSTSDYNGFGTSCNGTSDGQIIIFSPSGGTPNYDYSINGGNTFGNTMIHSNLAAGTYVVIVRDANGCTSDTTVVITEPLPFTISATTTSDYNGVNVSCHGTCDGSILVIPQNGVGTISYTLTNSLPQTSNTWSGLCGDITFGSYNIDAVDANGCTANTTISLSEPQPWSYTVDSTLETCNLSNGQASINVTQGGTAPYAYLWDDPSAQITSTATGLVTGMYEVRVTDVNGCTFLEDIFVDEADITLDFDSIPPCNNGADGSATVIPNGTPPYNILWETGETTNTINGLSPGFYSVTVVDGTGCIVTDSVEVPASAIVDVVLDANNSMLNVACFGYPSNAVSVIATGGTGANTYLYYIPNVFPVAQASNIFSGLYAGTYPIYAVDANGCFDSVVVTINQPDELMFLTSSSSVDCYGGNNGIASVDTVYGGTPPYFYTWSNGATTAINNNLSAGTYIVSVTDANSCNSNPLSDTIIVNEPSQLQTNTSVISNSNCAGSQALATGEVAVSVSGGTPGYSYLWNNGDVSSSINLLLPGIYTVQVTDDNGCIANDTTEVLAGENPDLDVVIQNVSCFGANDGLMFTSAIGGLPPYQFSSDGGNTFVPSGTPFGPSGQAGYFITVVDALGCTDSDSVFVSEPELLQISNVLIQNVNCYDSADGELTVQHVGGTSPFTYLWNDPLTQTTVTAIGIEPGSYNVIVTDTMGCSDTSITVTVTQPDSLYISSITSTSVLCNGGSNGTATVIVAGGTSGYNYNWNTGGTNFIDSNLTAGNYTVNVTDVNGCFKSASITVLEPSPITATFIKDSVTCVGGNDGWATVLASGGVGSYSYLWQNGSTTNTANNLNAGYHKVIIKDSNNCSYLDSVQILEPTFSITIDSLIISEITCHDANNASITVLATGGQQPYLYSNTNGFNSQSTIGFVNLSPNTYIMHVEDSRGCVDRDTVDIINPDSLYIDSTIYTNIQCNGFNNGSIQAINAYGGTPPYMYAVNGGLQHSNMAYFNGYGPGTYTVEVFDLNNCAAQDIIIIEEPAALDVDITTSIWNNYQIRCHGDTSGFANIAVSGGVGPYLRLCYDVLGNLIDSTYNPLISGLGAGVYNFIAVDANSCTDTNVITYFEPNPITHNFIPTHVSCNGWSNGSLIDSVYGGVGTATTYIYSWNTGDSTYSLTGIPVGTYTMTVVDENGCISSDSYTLNNSAALSLSINNSITEMVSCFDYCDGIIGLNVVGGLPNINASGNPVYNYQWDDILSQNTKNAIGLCADNTSLTTTYSCIVTDAQGCSDTISYTLSQPADLIVDANIVEDIDCFGDNNGRITATATGGNGSNTYIWNNWTNWNNNPMNNNLISASYVVVVKDVNGCMDTTEIYLSEPELLEVDVTKTDVSCFAASDGQIIANPLGGTPFPGIPPTYDYTWSPGGQTGKIATNLDPDVYTVTVTDQNGCSVTSASIYITQPSNPLTVIVDSTDETCLLEDGTATAFVSGGTQPYEYSWTGSESGNWTSNPIINLSSQTYTCVITDANGCTTSSFTFVNGVRNIFLPNNLDRIDTMTCLGSSIVIDVEEKPGLSYSWSNGENSADIDILPTSIGPNQYILEITDPNCIEPYSDTVNVFVWQIKSLLETSPEEVSFSSYPIISPDKAIHHVALIAGSNLSVYSNSNSNISHSWEWDGGSSTNSSIIIEEAQNTNWYHLTLDSAGCMGYDSLYVVVGVSAYDAITPNGDNSNDVWNILGITSYSQATVKVFNRWGSMVYETVGGLSYQPWDGTKDGEPLPVGTYYYVIDLNNGDDPQTGPITILR